MPPALAALQGASKSVEMALVPGHDDREAQVARLSIPSRDVNEGTAHRPQARADSAGVCAPSHLPDRARVVGLYLAAFSSK